MILNVATVDGASAAAAGSRWSSFAVFGLLRAGPRQMRTLAILIAFATSCLSCHSLRGFTPARTADQGLVEASYKGDLVALRHKLSTGAHPDSRWGDEAHVYFAKRP